MKVSSNSLLVFIILFTLHYDLQIVLVRTPLSSRRPEKKIHIAVYPEEWYGQKLYWLITDSSKNPVMLRTLNLISGTVGFVDFVDI